ncbi:MAG: ribosome maturation factor RimP [Candidatus Omnitrophica bacterium]|nr:ribosome maturation factor RimP [Candidatus Omnitrophota bacterium]MBU1852511.1 ribosome maturation factor RimP [Candidatus Omnitrophota bacterium]
MTDQIKQIIEPVLHEENIELVEAIYRREAGTQVLRLLIDKEGGVTLGDCTRLNETISRILDENNLITERYILEVDSPGIDRPFKEKRDYERAKGRLVRVTLNEAILDKKEYIGRLQEILNESIKVETEKKGVLDIPFEKIIRARQEIEF